MKLTQNLLLSSYYRLISNAWDRKIMHVQPEDDGTWRTLEERDVIRTSFRHSVA